MGALGASGANSRLADALLHAAATTASPTMLNALHAILPRLSLGAADCARLALSAAQSSNPRLLQCLVPLLPAEEAMCVLCMLLQH